MINKQVKNYGEGVNRSTPIDLKTIDNEVAKIAGRSPRTPIDMQSLWNEVQNLKATAKSWEIVTLNPSSNKYLIPEKFRNGWKWCVLRTSQSIRVIKTEMKKGNIEINDYGIHHWCELSDRDGRYRGFDFNYRIDGNYFVPSFVSYEGINSITVLFYK